MIIEMIENVYVKGRNKLSQYQHRHFHPSGDPKPSREDIDLTKRLAAVGEIIGINVLDHIVIGENKFVSMRSKGIMEEKEELGNLKNKMAREKTECLIDR